MPLPATQERSCRGCVSRKADVCDSFILRAGSRAARLDSMDSPEGEPGWSKLVDPGVLPGLSPAKPRFSPCCGIFYNSSFLVCKLVKGGDIRVVPRNLRLCLYSSPMSYRERALQISSFPVLRLWSLPTALASAPW